MKRTAWAVLMVSALSISAGCGSKHSPANQVAPANAGTPTPSIQRKKATFAPGPKGAVLYLSEMAAEGLGTFDKEGVDLTVLSTKGGTDATQALLDGKADFAMLAFDHVLKNRELGADLVVVAFLSKNPATVMIVRSDLRDTVKSIKDLKGQKVGVSSLGGGTHGTALSLMKHNGMSTGDIEFREAKDKLAEMWEKKEVAAAVHVDPVVTDLVAANKAFVLYDLRKDNATRDLYGSDYPLGTLVTRQEVIQRDPELVQRVVNAVMQSATYIGSHSPAEVAAKVPGDYKAGSQVYEQIVAENVSALSLDLKASNAGMQTVFNELISSKAVGAANKDQAIAKALNLTFVDKATK